MENLDQALTNQAAILAETGDVLTGINTLEVKVTDLEKQIADLKATGIAETDPRFAQLLDEQAKTTAALDAAKAALNPPTAPTV